MVFFDFEFQKAVRSLPVMVGAQGILRTFNSLHFRTYHNIKFSWHVYNFAVVNVRKYAL